MFYGTESYCCSNFRVTALGSFLSKLGAARSSPKTIRLRGSRVQEEPDTPCSPPPRRMFSSLSLSLSLSLFRVTVLRGNMLRSLLDLLSRVAAAAAAGVLIRNALFAADTRRRNSARVYRTSIRDTRVGGEEKEEDRIARRHSARFHSLLITRCFVAIAR